jgi:HEAT repeat protein
MRLDGEPRAIVWGSDERTLHLTDFPRPPVMLAHQLANASPVPARIEAVHALADHLAEPTAVRALARAVRSDAFWGVRVRATTVLGGATANADSALVAILEATGDRDARVRAAAAGALGVLAVADPMLIPLAFERGAPATDALRAERTARLEALISTDQSRHVRGAAVRSLATLDRERGLRAVRAMLSRESWTDLERRAAVEALAVVRGPVARELAREALRAAHPATRAAAVETFATLGAGHGVETGALLRPLLADESVLVRLAVARALASLRDPGALGDLEARLAVEWDPAVRAALERGINRLRGGIED